MVEATQEVTKTETAEVKTKKEKKSQEKKKDDTSSKTSQDGLITIDQFFATEIKIGTILTVEKVKKSNKLFKIKVDIGEENPRQVVAGIQQYYTEDELINTQVCLVANLKPAKLMGIESQGMLLAGKDEDGLSLIRPEKPKKIGTRIQ
jgi:methionyl-tRNA synthetase